MISPNPAVSPNPADAAYSAAAVAPAAAASIAGFIARLPAEGASAASLVRATPSVVIGQFGAYRLASQFSPVVDAEGALCGHTAVLRARHRDSANDLSPQALFALARDDDELIHLDRLVRTVHAVNYFARPRGTLQLFLDVEARLLAAVPEQHGRAFQRVLNGLGVPTDRVVIELPPSANEHPLLLTAVAANYRFRGYVVAVTLPPPGETQDALFDRFSYCRPDIVRFAMPVDDASAYASHLVRCLNGVARLMATDIDDQQALEAARSAKVALMQGRVITDGERV